ncbi:dihydrolipoamide acetyltransferase family protein [Specibacter cremeus]|uniref:dihydrolipoamide acetyltransferase family protein n=1 Tax=Specibacter cremeus TaxID=1629051 RepID=UPI000F7A6325|nr:dihydrolipoamide acetyltransferase family protein [Specibacter cremeus]
MIKEFRLPDLGEGLTESEILAWRVAVGDTVSLNQVIAEVETAKAVVELPSPYDGVVTAILEQPGTTVEVGSPIIAFELASDSAAGPAGGSIAATAPAMGSVSAEVEAKRVPTLVGYGAEPDSTGRPARRRRTAAGAATSPEPVVAEPVATAPAAERPRSTPPVRKLARDLGVDLATVPGTGERGLVTREDVLGVRGAPATTAPVPAGDSAREVRTPIKGVRKFTAEAMVASAFTAPHVTEFLTVDVTDGMAFLDRLRASRDFADLKLTPLTLAARAVCVALARTPELNSRWDGERNEIVTMKYVNLGIAAATPRGLMVPNIKDAHLMDLRALSGALSELAQTARAGRTAPSDLAGGTFSITNVGVFGIDAGTPILNPGEAGILAMGAVRRQPWEHDGAIALRQVLTLSLSFDHRLVDGAQGARLLTDVAAIMADPAMALALA